MPLHNSSEGSTMGMTIQTVNIYFLPKNRGMKSIHEWVKKVVNGAEQSAASPSPASGTPPPPATQHSKPKGGNPPPRPQQGKGPQHPPAAQPQKQQIVMPSGKSLRIYPLGGFEEVGRNCMVVDVD